MSASARADARCRTILRILMQRDRSVIYNKKILNNLAKMFRSVLCYSLPPPLSSFWKRKTCCNLPWIYLTRLGQVRSKEKVAKACNFPCVLYLILFSGWELQKCVIALPLLLEDYKLRGCTPFLAWELKIVWLHYIPRLGIKMVWLHSFPLLGLKMCAVALPPLLTWLDIAARNCGSPWEETRWKPAIWRLELRSRISRINPCTLLDR